ncbi:MAG: winged helix-turn-helix domain-containing protein [Candidatus Acidiferrales bacterium]
MKRFGVFELDVDRAELRKHGLRIKLQDQPLQVLALLLEKPGEVVTREELRRRLWPADTFVDFDNGLNAAVNKVREALNDLRANPRFVETVPRRGYRFVAPVQTALPPTAGAALPPSTMMARGSTAAPGLTELPRIPPAPRVSRKNWTLLTLAAVLLPLASAFAAWRFFAPTDVKLSRRIMLAVLPFQNLTNNTEHDYFIAGLSEEMITKLGSLQPERLGVIARGSVLPYKGKSVREVGRDLNVQYILEGSVRGMGNRVRISIQLVQVSDQTHLWAQNYERDLADIFAIQSDVARQVAGNLALKLVPDQQAALDRAATDVMAAYEEYLRGRYYWNLRTEEGLSRCRPHFEKAIAADPQYAVAYAGLADCYNLNGGYAILAPNDAFPKAKQAARKALELDSSLAPAHAALGFALLYHDWNAAEAEMEFRRAIELNPNYVFTRLSYAQLLRAQNRLDEAETQLRLACEVDPMDRVGQSYSGWVAFSRQRYAQASEIFRSTIANHPNWPSAYVSLAYALAQEAKLTEALAALDRARLLSADSPSALEAYAYVAALAGKKDDARRIIGQLIALSGSRRISAYNMAMIYVALGEPDSAFSWLERALEARDPWLIWLGTHPEWNPLRSDPRFARLQHLGQP